MADVSSLNSLSSCNAPRSLRLIGKHGNTEFHVLIDNGSTHNFIPPKLVDRLNLVVSPIPKFRVYIGNGDSLVCQHKCSAVNVELQGTIFSLDFFVLQIQGPDMILGVQWLQELGPVTHDYSCSQMEFNWKGKKVTLRGDASLSSKEISFNMLQRAVHSDTVGALFECVMLSSPSSAPIDPPTDLTVTYPPAMQALIKEFSSVFATPTELPPRRLFEHRIHLEPGSKPVNVRPYRYPYFQKTEMEKLVREMLDQGIIRPSQSPFSSPVLLVKKRDGTFRFCVDYRALNAVTIKDRFPIPTVDELLDELGQSVIFSKLDLRSGYHQIRVHEKDAFKKAFRTHGTMNFLSCPSVYLMLHRLFKPQ